MPAGIHAWRGQGIAREASPTGFMHVTARLEQAQVGPLPASPVVSVNRPSAAQDSRVRSG